MLVSRIFDAYVFVDWSARSRPSSACECTNALWVGERTPAGVRTQTYFRTRDACVAALLERLTKYVCQGQRVLVSFDFPFGYPAGFAAALGLKGWRDTWGLLEELIHDGPRNENNRFRAAAELNARCLPTAPGPFWGCPPNGATSDLAPTRPAFPYPTRAGTALTSLRVVDGRARPLGIQEVWKLTYPASVGGQALLGIPRVAWLRGHPELRNCSAVWPFETGFNACPAPRSGPFVLFAEVWPGTVRQKVDPAASIRDQDQVRALVSWAVEEDTAGRLGNYLAAPSGLSAEEQGRCLMEEGWILGV